MQTLKLFRALVLGGIGLTLGPIACAPGGDPALPDGSTPPNDAALSSDAAAGDAATTPDAAAADSAARDVVVPDDASNASRLAPECVPVSEYRDGVWFCEGACCWLVQHECCPTDWSRP